jgi:hypothetical protein
VPFSVVVCHLGGERGLKNTEQVLYKQSRKIMYIAHDSDTVDKDKELVEPLSDF